MDTINNLRLIRELYGATQEQVAKALSVNRMTVANWENGNSTASAANQEKLSMYFGIGPEFIYDKPLSDDAKKVILSAAEHSQKVVDENEKQLSKEEVLSKVFDSVSFSDALNQYIVAMKMMLATADQESIATLENALQIYEKMGNRLKLMVELRHDESKDGATLQELLQTVQQAEKEKALKKREC